MKRKTYIETGVSFHVIDTEEDFHSFKDLKLVLAPFVIPPAKPKINLLDIEGMDGSLDLTEANGEIKYFDRELKFTFTVFPQDDCTFEERQTIVSNAINGKRCKITLDKDPDYYFIGRCMVNDHLCDKMLRQIVVIATVSPYKLLQNVTLTEFTVYESGTTLYVTNRRKKVTPTISCILQNPGSDQVKITNERTGVYVNSRHGGEINIPEFQLVQGVNKFTVTGANGSILFSYQEGDL